MSFIVPKRKQILDVDEDTKVVCLAVINGADKPMYAFDWGFLDKYLIEGPHSKLWKESVILIAKQSTKSTSAFRLLYKCYDHHSNFDVKFILLNIFLVFSCKSFRIFFFRQIKLNYWLQYYTKFPILFFTIYKSNL